MSASRSGPNGERPERRRAPRRSSLEDRARAPGDARAGAELFQRNHRARETGVSRSPSSARRTIRRPFLPLGCQVTTGTRETLSGLSAPRSRSLPLFITTRNAGHATHGDRVVPVESPRRLGVCSTTRAKRGYPFRLSLGPLSTPGGVAPVSRARTRHARGSTVRRDEAAAARESSRNSVDSVRQFFCNVSEETYFSQSPTAAGQPTRGWDGTEQDLRNVNDPSAGSPTETLLRLLLPLNDQVWSSSRQHRQCRRIAAHQSEDLTKSFNR